LTLHALHTQSVNHIASHAHIGSQSYPSIVLCTHNLSHTSSIASMLSLSITSFTRTITSHNSIAFFYHPMLTQSLNHILLASSLIHTVIQWLPCRHAYSHINNFSFLVFHTWVKNGVRSPKFIWSPVYTLYSCTNWLGPRISPHPPAFVLMYEGSTLLVSQDRRHLFVTL
jgi:hypothetical protein